MGRLSPVWFLESPLDIEHKNYILLDFLKKKSESLDPDKVLDTLKEISSIVKYLSAFKTSRDFPDQIKESITIEENQILSKIRGLEKEDHILEEIDLIIEDSLNLLYDFSEVCMEIIEEEQEKIKIFRIESRFDKLGLRKKSGILLIRNMFSDKIISYYWKETKIKTDDIEKDVVVLKKINLSNKKFSISYEYLYHEVLLQIEAENGYSPLLYIVEIDEDFNEKSPIFKMAKERFIQILSQDI
jgi:hypothetical protein